MTEIILILNVENKTKNQQKKFLNILEWLCKKDILKYVGDAR